MTFGKLVDLMLILLLPVRTEYPFESGDSLGTVCSTSTSQYFSLLTHLQLTAD